MMGVELLGPLVMKLLGGLAVVIALLSVYFGIKHKGRLEERQRQAAATYEAQQAAQRKLDDARAKDQEIDEEGRRRLEELDRPKPPPDPPGGYKPGDRFKFGLALALGASLVGCSVPVMTSIRVDLPPRPILPVCAEIPQVEAVIVEADAGLAAQLGLEDAQVLREYLATAPACWQGREILLEGHITKLENRLRAVSSP